MRKSLILVALLVTSLNSSAGELMDYISRKFDAVKSNPPTVQAIPDEDIESEVPAWGSSRKRVDSRYIDERSQDERGVSAVDSYRAQDRILRTKKDKGSVSATKKLKAQDIDSPAQASYSNCSNPARSWEGAEAVARKGNDKAAYATYVGLLTSCSTSRDLKGTVYQATVNLTPASLDRLIQEPILAGPRMKPIKLYAVSQRLLSANANKETDVAAYYSAEYKEELFSAKDLDAMEVIGWQEYNSKQFKDAVKSFKAGLKVDNARESLREGLVLSYLALNKTEMALKEADKLEDEESESFRGTIKYAQAQKALKNKEYKEALSFLNQAQALGVDDDEAFLETKAWALLGAGQADKAVNIFGALSEDYPENSAYKRGYVESLTKTGNVNELKKLAVENSAASDRAREAVADHYSAQGRRDEASKWSSASSEGFESNVGADVGFRHKSGKAGEGKLKEAVVPQFSAKYNINSDTSIDGSVIRRSMSDSVVSKTGTEVMGRITTTLSDTSVASLAAGSAAVGNGSSAMYDVKYKKWGDRASIEVGSSRRPITESVRSYSGVNDPTAGFVGKVSRTDIYARGSYMLDSDLKATWSAAMGRASGSHVDDNDFAEARANILKDFTHADWAWLSAGPEIAFSAWNRDQNQYTGKNGGYWSPESDIQVGMRGNALSHEGGESIVKATGFFGYADRTLFFGSTSGAVFETDINAGILFSPYLIGKAGGTVRTSPGYSEFRGWVGLEIPFTKRTGLYSSDLKELLF